MRPTSRGGQPYAQRRSPAGPINTYSVAVGMLLIAGIAFARVALSAQITKYGYRLDGLQRRQLELLEENRSLKVEVGTRQSATRMLGKLEDRGETMVRYDEARVVTVETKMDLLAPRPGDMAARFAREVADATRAGVEVRMAGRSREAARLASSGDGRPAEMSR